MTSRKKKITLFITTTFLALLLGMVIGIAISRPYFESISKVNVTVSRAFQAYSFAKDFGNNEPTKAKRHILLELELNLSKLILMRKHLSSLQKEEICHRLSVIAKDKQSLIHLANHTDDVDTHISRLEDFLNQLERCDTW